jgi:hypothetical protein
MTKTINLTATPATRVQKLCGLVDLPERSQRYVAEELASLGGKNHAQLELLASGLVAVAAQFIETEARAGRVGYTAVQLDAPAQLMPYLCDALADYLPELAVIDNELAHVA